MSDSIHQDHFVAALYDDIVRGEESSFGRQKDLVKGLQNYEQKTVLYCVIRTLSKRLINVSASVIGGAGAAIADFCKNTSSLHDHLESWLVAPSPEAIGYNDATHRAVVLAMSIDIGKA